jgi:hypothetical protein
MTNDLIAAWWSAVAPLQPLQETEEQRQDRVFAALRRKLIRRQRWGV